MNVGSFAWLVPMAFASFAGVFLVLRLHAIGSYWWAAAFAFAGGAFTVSIFPAAPEAVAKPLFEDTLFVFAFSAYAFGTAQRLGDRARPSVVALAFLVGIGGAALALTLYSSVRLELLAVQTATAILVLEAARILRRQGRHLPDRILFWLSVAVAVDFTLQSAALLAFPDPSLTVATWQDSSWAFALQASGATIGTLLAVAVLVAIGHDIVDRLSLTSQSDPLTGILNRRGFAERSAPFLRRRDPERPGCVILVDIDHFKSVNDAHGHGVGDAVICAMASLLNETAGPKSVVARFGGEEFGLFLPELDLPTGRLLAERMRTAFAAIAWPKPVAGMRLTASFGLTDLHADEDAIAAAERADRMLYYAKRSGRDAVCWCSADSRIVPPDENGIGHPGEFVFRSPPRMVA